MNTHDKPKTKWIRDLWSHVMTELAHDDTVYLPEVTNEKIIIHERKVKDMNDNLAYVHKQDAIYAARKSLERRNNQ